jgi:hypothetical protein
MNMAAQWGHYYVVYDCLELKIYGYAVYIGPLDFEI